MTQSKKQISQISERLFLGREIKEKAKRFLVDQLGIKGVINCSRETQNSLIDECQYLHIAEDDSAGTNLLPYFSKAIEFVRRITEEQEEKGCVLIHCRAGVSRSPTVMMAVLMAIPSPGMRLIHAVELVRSKRPWICPRWQFMEQLRHFEASLFGSCSLKPHKKSHPETLSVFVEPRDREIRDLKEEKKRGKREEMLKDSLMKS